MGGTQKRGIKCFKAGQRKRHFFLFLFNFFPKQLGSASQRKDETGVCGGIAIVNSLELNKGPLQKARANFQRTGPGVPSQNFLNKPPLKEFRGSKQKSLESPQSAPAGGTLKNVFNPCRKLPFPLNYSGSSAVGAPWGPPP